MATFTATRTAMYSPIGQTAAAANVKITSAAMSRGRGLLASPPPVVNTFFTLEAIQARYGGCFARAMRMPADAVVDLVDIFRPRLPRRRLSSLCRTALALRFFGGSSSVDICAVLGVHPGTLYRSLWEVIDAINATPSLDVDVQLRRYERPRVVGEQVEGMWLFAGRDTRMGSG